MISLARVSTTDDGGTDLQDGNELSNRPNESLQEILSQTTTEASIDTGEDTGVVEKGCTTSDAMGTQTEIVKQDEAMKIAASLLVDFNENEELNFDKYANGDPETTDESAKLFGVGDMNDSVQGREELEAKINQADTQNKVFNVNQTAAERLIEKFKLFNDITTCAPMDPDDVKSMKQEKILQTSNTPSSLVDGNSKPNNQRIKPPFAIPKKYSRKYPRAVHASGKKHVQEGKVVINQQQLGIDGQKPLANRQQRPPTIEQNRIYMEKVNSLKKSFNLKLRQESLQRKQNSANVGQSVVNNSEICRRNSTGAIQSTNLPRKRLGVWHESPGMKNKQTKVAELDINTNKIPHTVDSALNKGPPMKISVKIMCEKGPLSTKTTPRGVINRVDKAVQITTLRKLAITNAVKSVNANEGHNITKTDSTSNSNPLTVRKQNIERLKELIKKQEKAVERIKTEKLQLPENKTEDDTFNSPGTSKPNDIYSSESLNQALIVNSEKQLSTTVDDDIKFKNIVSSMSKTCKQNLVKSSDTQMLHNLPVQSLAALTTTNDRVIPVQNMVALDTNSIANVTNHTSDAIAEPIANSKLPKIISVCSLAGLKHTERKFNLHQSIVHVNNSQLATTLNSIQNEMPSRNSLQQSNSNKQSANHSIVRSLLQAKTIQNLELGNKPLRVGTSASSVTTAKVNYSRLSQPLTNQSNFSHSYQMGDTFTTAVLGPPSLALTNTATKQADIQKSPYNVSATGTTSSVPNAFNMLAESRSQKTSDVTKISTPVVCTASSHFGIAKLKEDLLSLATRPAKSVQAKQPCTTENNISSIGQKCQNSLNVGLDSTRQRISEPKTNTLIKSSSSLQVNPGSQNLNSRIQKFYPGARQNSAVCDQEQRKIPDLCINSELARNISMPNIPMQSNPWHLSNYLQSSSQMQYMCGIPHLIQPLPGLSCANVSSSSNRVRGNLSANTAQDFVQQLNVNPTGYQRVILIQDQTQQRFVLYPVNSQNIPGSFLVRAEDPAITRQRVPELETAITSLHTINKPVMPSSFNQAPHSNRMPNLASIARKPVNASTSLATIGNKQGNHTTGRLDYIAPSDPKATFIRPPNLGIVGSNATPLNMNSNSHKTVVSSAGIMKQNSKPGYNSSTESHDPSPYWLECAAKCNNSLPEHLRLVIESCKTNVVESIFKQASKNIDSDCVRLRFGLYENQFVLKQSKREPWNILPKGTDQEFLKLVGLEQVIRAVEVFPIPESSFPNSETSQTKSPDENLERIRKADSNKTKLKSIGNTELRCQEASVGDKTDRLAQNSSIAHPSVLDVTQNRKLIRKRKDVTDKYNKLSDQPPFKKNVISTEVPCIENEGKVKQSDGSMTTSTNDNCPTAKECGTESYDSNTRREENQVELKHLLRQVWVRVEDILKSGKLYILA